MFLKLFNRSYTELKLEHREYITLFHLKVLVHGLSVSFHLCTTQ